MAPTRTWTSQLNSKFISLYRKQTCLWKTDDPSYRDKFKREQAVKQIVIDMGIPDLTVVEAKKRIKSLRGTYLIELKKILESKQSNDEERLYEPKLSWFKEMDAFIKYRHDKTECKSKNEIEPISNETDEDEKSIDLVDNLENWDTNVDTPSPCNERTSKRQQENDNSQTSLIRINTGFDEQEEFQIFGKHVASQLSRLSTTQAILAQSDIQSVITKRRLQDLRLKNAAKISRKRTRERDFNTEDSSSSEKSNDDNNVLKEDKYF